MLIVITENKERITATTTTATATTAQITEQLSRQRRIQNTVKHLRWSTLQKQCLSAGVQPEIFQSTGGRGFVELSHFNRHFVKNKRKKDPAGKQVQI